MDAIKEVKRDLLRLHGERETLMQRIADANVRLAQVEGAITELQTALDVVARYEHGPTDSREAQQPQQPADAPIAQRSATPIEVLKGTVLLLSKEGGGRLTLGEIIAKLADHGIKVGGVDPVKNLSTILSRNQADYNLESSRKLGWRLKETKSSDGSPAASDNGERV